MQLLKNNEYMACILLRVSSIFSKFLLIFFLAKLLDQYSIGIYSLFVSLTAYFSYFVGIEYYSFANRRLITANKEEKDRIIKVQLNVYLINFLITSTFVIILQIFNLINFYSILLFIPMLYFEHLSLELTRVLIANGKQLDASKVVFIKSGMWIFPLISVAVFLPNSYFTIEIILSTWLLFSIYSASWALRKLDINYFQLISLKFGLNNIYGSFFDSITFLISTVCLRSIFVFDKVLLERNGFGYELGVYAFYFTVSNTILTFLEVGVFQFFYQKLIKLAATDPHLLTKELFKMLVLTFVLSLTGSIFIFYSFKLYLAVFFGEGYLEDIYVLAYLLIINILICLTYCFHYFLYSLNKDKTLLFSNFISMIAFFYAVIMFGIDLNNIILALFASALILLMLKAFFSIIYIYSNKT
ncbi:hypothetical protein ACTL6P_04500 [Endozoicomonas acroporae]|uniref:hypothetical protein n=1 Tax=Endozoicomonas acroporae TaxID=1701104 RepID=UPI000C791619|nr:hypothetical protein [Endozoicomonas acroporae]